MRDAASDRQVQAADPGASTWLSANAGSGKTRVLTDRVARLLLAGVQPQHILCLTYTKAAATEMQNRLFKRLGDWAMKPDDDLRRALVDLGEDALPTATHLSTARRLFARAIETPGGLRIQTIHSFCATLLRRFPLEAGVSPQFTELDDRAARLLRDEIVEALCDTGAPGLMAEVARVYTGVSLADLAAQIAARRDRFAPPLDEAGARALFGVAAAESEPAILADVLLGDEADWMPTVIAAMGLGSVTDVKQAARLAGLRLEAGDFALLAQLEDMLLTGAGAKVPFSAKTGTFPTKPTQGRLSNVMPQLDALMLRIETARLRRIALHAAQKTALLHRFGAEFLPIYRARKASRGWLDFDDLITRAKALLTDPSVAAWVLYRLDGGIDHILVDEAQDTSPDQWRVIELLAAEFSAGQGLRDGGRTLFVVGDKKQSIYSFQGADVAGFDHKHLAFRSRFTDAGQRFQSLALEYSFRSARAVLDVVDRSFAEMFPEALGPVAHLAHKSMPGRVDLWPLIDPVRGEADEDWENPVDLVSEQHHTARLADQIAGQIRQMIDAGVQIPTDAGDRPVHAGDVLILVQRRSALFAEIIRACKQARLDIAGADRLKLGAELAVRDIAALLAVLALPEDDLSLAAVLRSPLCGWTEAELYDLAHGRGTDYLWQALRRAETPALHMLQDLRDQADFLRPYELIERALTRHDGRRRLLARLGAEAQDGIDELLSQALAYERIEVPSLTGFLVWLDTDDIEVKRQTDSEGQRIRVMTVHGAKGLEAPIVILADTTDRKPQDHDDIYAPPDCPPVWKTTATDSPPLMRAERDRRNLRRAEEGLRLLYVALTRARCWLIVAGAGEAKAEGREVTTWCWYRLVEQGMQAVGAVPVEGMLRHANGDWPAAVGARHQPARDVAALPDWALRRAADPVRPVPLVQPSDLGGAKVLPGDSDAALSDAAMARGTLLHLLLERLPEKPRQTWPRIAASLQAEPVLAEAVAVIDGFPDLFAPGTLAEVPVTADLSGRRLYGTIDRLLIGRDHVLAVDYKSNRIIPGHASQVPEGLLRQMAAYAMALAQVFPHHRIDTAILWTAEPRLMPLDPDIVRTAGQRIAMDGAAGLDVGVAGP